MYCLHHFLLPSVNHCLHLVVREISTCMFTLFFAFIVVYNIQDPPSAPRSHVFHTYFLDKWPNSQQACFTWILVALKGGIFQSQVDNCPVLSCSSPIILWHSFNKLTEMCFVSQLHIWPLHPTLHFFLYPPDCAVSLSSHQHADCWHQHSQGHLNGCIEHALSTKLWGEKK